MLRILVDKYPNSARYLLLK